MSNSPSIYSSVDKLNFNMAGKTMKALVKEKEGVSYKYMDYPVSEPGEGELLVRVTRTSICGSDLILYSWDEGIYINEK